MGGLSPIHIAILVGIALLVFGPKKLPEMGRSLGKGIREFKQATSGLKDEFDLGLDLQHLNPLTAITEPTPGAAPVATGAAAVTDESAAPVAVTSAESAAGTALLPEATTATLAGAAPPAVGEADVAALAAYGIDAEGNSVVADTAAAHVAPPAPPSVFVDAQGNEYHLTVAAAPTVESPLSAPTQGSPASAPVQAPPAL